MICAGNRSSDLAPMLVAAAVAAAPLAPTATPAFAQTEPPVPAAYAPYAFLIGEWDVGRPGGPPAAVTRFRWSSGKTYIWYSGALLVDGKEQPSFEGLLVWNGVRKNLDMLLVLDPTSGNLVQEQGTVHAEPDGTVVRTITVYYSPGNPVPPRWDRAAGPDGAAAEFRHTFTSLGADRIATTIMYKTADGWRTSFPGSDSLVMTRRPS